MGISDFFDPTDDFNDLQKDDYSQPEIAFIRRVENPLGSDDEDLKKALRSYVLAGGLKLFRQTCDPQRYKPEHFKHHTMLIHTSPLRGEHTSLATRVEDLWNQCALNTPKGLTELQALWNKDFAKVCATQAPKEIVPQAFTDLVPHLSEAIKRIEKGPRFYLVVNSDTAEAPDFSSAPVWKVIVGGNKLSRGYTIEGLTVSYYRRVANTADTLMQMGRWFGFRPGYRDLVRVFLGVKDGKRGDTDLVSLFKEVCQMEERFREELKRYVRRPGSAHITPRQIPPLISVSGNLPPAARNKMFNAVLASKNFGGRWSMLTMTPAEPSTLDTNLKALRSLLTSAKSLGKQTLGGQSSEGKTIRADSLLFEASNEQLTAFLKTYHWLEAEYTYPERPTDIGLQIEFLEKQKHGIKTWLILAPQRNSSFGQPISFKDVADLTVKERHRVSDRRFQIFGESAHRAIAEFLADVLDPNKLQLALPNPVTKAMRDVHRGIFLTYPVRENENDKASVGFETLFPNNALPFDTNFTVVRKAQQARIVVPAPAPSGNAP
jgi:hypothetical protein